MEVFEKFLKTVEKTNLTSMNKQHGKPNSWGPLEKAIPGLAVHRGQGIYPYEAYGTIHGHSFHFYSKQEWASLRISEINKTDEEFDSLYFTGAPAPSVITHLEFCRLMLQLIPKLEKSPFRWEFEGVSLDFDEKSDEWGFFPTKDKQIFVGWGHTPEDGWLNAQAIDLDLKELGFNVEAQKKMWDQRNLNRTPLNADNRNWPEIPLTFEIAI